jgi:hypothetical protein
MPAKPLPKSPGPKVGDSGTARKANQAETVDKPRRGQSYGTSFRAETVYETSGTGTNIPRFEPFWRTCVPT